MLNNTQIDVVMSLIILLMPIVSLVILQFHLDIWGNRIKHWVWFKKNWLYTLCGVTILSVFSIVYALYTILNTIIHVFGF